METTLWKLMINCWILTVWYCGHAELAGTTEAPALALKTANNGRIEPKSFEVFEDKYGGDFPEFEEFAASAAKEFDFFRSSKFEDFKDSEDKASARQPEATIEGFTAVETTTQTVDSSMQHPNRKRPVDRNITHATPKSSRQTVLDHKGEGSSVVATKVAPHQPFPTYVEDGEELDGQTYLGTEEEPLPLRSLSIVTEISVQETKDGQTIKRKPTQEELRFLRQDLEEKYLAQNSIGNERAAKEDQVEDLESMLKSDDEADFESWSDDDEEPSDMEVILKQPTKPADKEAEPAKAQETDTSPEQGAKKGPDDGDYRKIFHTERKNFSNVQEVKIVISETEGDFFDDEEPFDMMKPFMKPANGTSVGNSSKVNELDGQVPPLNHTEAPISTTERDLLVVTTTEENAVVTATEENPVGTPTEADAVLTTTEVPAESTEKITTTTPEATTEEITTSTTTTTTRILVQSAEVNANATSKEIQPEDIISPHVLSELMSLIKDDSFPTSSQRPDIKVSSTSVEPLTPEVSAEPSTIRHVEATTPTLQPTVLQQQPTTQATVEPPSPAFTLKLLNEFSTFLSTEFPLGMSRFDGFQPTTTQPSSTVAPPSTAQPIAGSFVFKPTTPGHFDEDFEADDFFTEFPDPFETKEEGYDFDDLTPGEVESMFNEKLEDYEPFEDDEYDAVGMRRQKAHGKKPHDDWDKKKEVADTKAEDRSGSVASTEVPNEVSSKDAVDIKADQVTRKASFEITEAPKAASSSESDVVNTTTEAPVVTSESVPDVDVKANEIDTDNVEILVPVLKARILNNTAVFSIRINHKGDIYHIPETAHVKELPNLVNITWRTTQNQNNSVAFKIGENDASYTIEEIVINLLKGDQFHAQQTGVQPRPIDEQAHIIMMKDGTQITISNVDFLKKPNSTVNIKGNPKASLREAKLWHVEVASICLVTVILIATILYVIAIKTKPKIILRGKDDVPQVTHC